MRLPTRRTESAADTTCCAPQRSGHHTHHQVYGVTGRTQQSTVDRAQSYPIVSNILDPFTGDEMTHEDRERLDALRAARNRAIAAHDYREANRLHSQARLIDGGYLPTPRSAGGGSIATKRRRTTTGKHNAY